MIPRAPAASALLLMMLLAGCAAPPPAPASSTGDGPGTAEWHLACDRTAGWADPCTTRSTTTNGPANENWLAVNPTDAMNVVTAGKDYNDNASRCVWSGEESTKDGGRTWKNQFIGGPAAQRTADPSNPLATYQCITDPMFAFDNQGILYYVVEAYGRVPHERQGLAPIPPGTPLGPFERTIGHPDTGGNTMFIATSRDGGETFGPLVRVWDGEGILALLDDKTFILANPKTGSVHFATSQFAAPAGGSATQILVFTSRDQGQTWGQPVVASDPQDGSQKFPVALSADRNGTLHLSWHDWNANQILFTTSRDDGATFETPRVIVAATSPMYQAPPGAQFRVVTQPYQATDASGGPRDGSVYVTWMENVSGHMDVQFVRSHDGGQSWSAPRLVTPNPGGHERFHPAITVDAWGAVHVTFYDRSYDPANKLVDLTWAIAPDGENFTSFRVTNTSFDGDLGFHQDGFPFLGDYNGLACSGPTCYASFADTRMGRSDIAVARLVRG